MATDVEHAAVLAGEACIDVHVVSPAPRKHLVFTFKDESRLTIRNERISYQNVIPKRFDPPVGFWIFVLILVCAVLSASSILITFKEFR